MKVSKFLKVAMVALACGGVCLPQSAMAAKPVVVNGIPVHGDVESLELQGELLVGGLVDHAGKGVADAPVLIAQNGKPVTELRTDADGRFAAKGLQPGRYQVVSHGGVQTYDVFAKGQAPQHAKRGVVHRVDPQVARGAPGSPFRSLLSHPMVIATAIAAAVAIPLSLNDDAS